MQDLAGTLSVDSLLPKCLCSGPRFWLTLASLHSVDWQGLGGVQRAQLEGNCRGPCER